MVPKLFLSESLKCIFIHIPKTAGTAIRVSLDLIGEGYHDKGGHVTWEYYRDNFPDQWESYFKFAIVRNPYDRFFSAYKYAMSEKTYWSEKVKLPHVDVNVVKRFGSFTEFCENFNDVKNELQHHCWRPQSDFIVDNDVIVVDMVLRYENLSEDFPRLCSRLNIQDRVLQDINVSPYLKGRSFIFEYTEKAFNVVRTEYAKDFNFFGYS